jgi:hypothetical protein
MREETRLRFAGFSDGPDEFRRLKTRKQIELFRLREAAKCDQAERKEAEARVRHLNVDLAMRIVLLVLAIGIAISVIIGAAGDPEALKLSLVAAGAWGSIAAALSRLLRPMPSDRSEKRTKRCCWAALRSGCLGDRGHRLDPGAGQASDHNGVEGGVGG